MDILKEIFKSYKKNDEYFVKKIVSIIDCFPNHRELLLTIEKHLPNQDDKLLNKSLSAAWKNIWVKNIDAQDKELLEKYFPLIGFNHQKKIQENISSRFEFASAITLNQIIKDYKNGNTRSLEIFSNQDNRLSNTEKKRVIYLISDYFIDGTLPLFTNFIKKQQYFFNSRYTDSIKIILNCPFEDFQDFFDVSLSNTDKENILDNFIYGRQLHYATKEDWVNRITKIVNNSNFNAIDNIIYVLENCRDYFQINFKIPNNQNILIDLMNDFCSEENKHNDDYLSALKKVSSYCLQKELTSTLKVKEKSHRLKL